MPQYGPYRTVVVDPPWPLVRFGRPKVRPQEPRTLDYKTMSLTDLDKFPINQWASEDAYLFLWATQRHLQVALQMASVWGFRHHATLTWCKDNGICPYSPFRFTSEFVIFATRDGKVFRQFPLGKLGTWFRGKTFRHSQKPAEFYDMLLPYTPEPRIDLFARSLHPGYDAWGDEAPAQPHQDIPAVAGDLPGQLTFGDLDVKYRS